MITDVDLAALRAADFETGKSLKIKDLPDGLALSMTVVEVRSLGQSERPGGAFSVLLTAPSEPMLAQGTWQVDMDGLGRMHLFLVPLGPSDGSDTVGYEALFG